MSHIHLLHFLLLAPSLLCYFSLVQPIFHNITVLC
jgi:hypothetical protein